MAQRIRVSAPHGEDYDIVIERGLLADAERLVNEFGLGGTVAIITSETILDLYARPLAQSLPNAKVLAMADGEQHKNLATFTMLHRQLAEHRCDRKTTVVALGGGVVGDTAGFVAATYMRGVRLVQVPTTLLSMVDSSVGGKVAVDIPEGKNLVGAFKQPAAVLIDPTVLATLPPVEYRCGMAEALKHGLLADVTLLEPRLHAPDQIESFLERAIRVKVDVVEQDPFEQGLRQTLNLGHTFGHALEQVSQYAWKHGEAVAVGLVAAARLSSRLKLLDEQTAIQIEDLLAETGLPTYFHQYEPEALWQAMHTDKKWQSGHSRFILLEGMNRAVVHEDIPKEEVIAVLASMRRDE